MWASEPVQTIALQPVYHTISELVQCMQAQLQRYLCPCPRAILGSEDFRGPFRQSRTRDQSTTWQMNTEVTSKAGTLREGGGSGCPQSCSGGGHRWTGLPQSPVCQPMASKGISGWPVEDFSEGKCPLGLISGGDGLLLSFKTEGS